jgi:hypothetical protein
MADRLFQHLPGRTEKNVNILVTIAGCNVNWNPGPCGQKEQLNIQNWHSMRSILILLQQAEIGTQNPHDVTHAQP